MSRWIRTLGIAVVMGCVLAANVEGKTPIDKVGGVDHVGLTVSSLELSSDFFTQVLGFEQVGSDPDYPSRFFSNGAVLLTLWQADADPIAFDRRKNIGLHHLALRVESFESLDRLHGRVKAAPGVTIEFAPELLGTGPAKHMMFREPSGNRLELIHRPTTEPPAPSGESPS